jgi:hypothetical protein
MTPSTGDQILFAGSDQAGAEWQDIFIAITTATQDMDDLATVDGVWDEVLTAATHNIANSAGRRLRQTAALVIREDTAQGPGTGTNQIQLDAAASAVDGAYDPTAVAIVGGTGAGQSRLVLGYEGATKTATVDRDWKVNPDATSEFQILANPGREHVNEGLAQGGTPTTITLNTLASNANDAYINQIIFIRSGTGADQARRVVDYDGATKVATINGRVWDTTPDTTSAYVMLPTGIVEMNDTTIADAVLGRNMASVTGAASRSLLNAIRFLRNRWEIVAGTLSVYEEDDATPAWTGAVTTAVSDPASEIDPT